MLVHMHRTESDRQQSGLLVTLELCVFSKGLVSLYSFFWVGTYLPAYEDGREKSVPKRPHIKFRRRGITQKKAYSVQNTAKV